MWPGVTGAIVGARSPSQVDGWIGAATLELTAPDLDEIASAIDAIGVGAGPTRPPNPLRVERTAVTTNERALS